MCCLLSVAEYLVAEELAADAFGKPELLLARAKLASCYVPASGALLQELIQANNGSPKFRPYTEKNLKALLEGFDQIESEYCRPLDVLIAAESVAIRQSFTKGLNKNQADVVETSKFFGERDIQEWAERNGQLLAEVLPLSAHVSIIRYIAPERYTPPSPQDAKELEVMTGGMVSLQDLYYIMEALRSDKIAPLLPTRFDVVRLRASAQRVKSEAQRLFKMPEVLRHQVRIASALREVQSELHHKANAAISPRNDSARDKLKRLGVGFVSQTSAVIGVPNDERSR